MNKRSTNRLKSIRALPCVSCGKAAPSEAAHANWSEYGKGMGVKAADSNTVSLCRICHHDFDTYAKRDRVESKAWFEKMLEKTNRLLGLEEKEVF